MSQPWEDCPSLWKNKSSFHNSLRSMVRRSWSRHPSKLEYKKKRRYKAPVGRYGKDVWVSDCEICGIQGRDHVVDHLVGGQGFTDSKEFGEWASRILYVSWDDIREICKECHTYVNLSQKRGIGFEDAKIESDIIRFCKLKVGQQKKELLSLGCVLPKKATKKDLEIIYRGYKDEPTTRS